MEQNHIIIHSTNFCSGPNARITSCYFAWFAGGSRRPYPYLSTFSSGKTNPSALANCTRVGRMNIAQTLLLSAQEPKFYATHLTPNGFCNQRSPFLQPDISSKLEAVN